MNTTPIQRQKINEIMKKYPAHVETRTWFAGIEFVIFDVKNPQTSKTIRHTVNRRGVHTKTKV